MTRETFNFLSKKDGITVGAIQTGMTPAALPPALLKFTAILWKYVPRIFLIQTDNNTRPH